jgi:hypothetical protein
MATNLRSDDTIQVVIPQGGGSKRAVTLSELNEYLTSAEETDISTLETYIGDYSSPAGGEGSDIATDLATVYGSVETAETGLNARTDDLETAVGTYSGENDIATDLATVYAQIDNAVAVVPTSGAPITAQVSATAITAEGENEEITWTAVANGEDGNGIAIDITLSTEATDIDIIVGVNAIAVDVKAGNGTTATDVLTAVNAHATAGLLVQGALTGGGGAITADSVETGGGKDITAGLAGAIRYEADKIWISTDESTASVSNWAYALLTDPNV